MFIFIQLWKWVKKITFLNRGIVFSDFFSVFCPLASCYEAPEALLGEILIPAQILKNGRFFLFFWFWCLFFSCLVGQFSSDTTLTWWIHPKKTVYKKKILKKSPICYFFSPFEPADVCAPGPPPGPPPAPHPANNSFKTSKKNFFEPQKKILRSLSVVNVVKIQGLLGS